MFNQNPFFPAIGGIKKAGLLGINWGNLLNNTQRTLSIINQAIPVFYQVKPLWGNAKTMFRVLGEVNKMYKTEKADNTPKENNTTSEKTTTVTNNAPNFFI